ncbi:toll/interleukin-1 receptor domain-containing protein [Hymenobacter sp. BT523]|uniref:toll/interleukin-1 receptor domain-containing protein n=1 Tax=Hymenobacter sp. BT523 TaxID=2795725 RepID=UPI0018EB487A|nr:toll/interleukin-1 receptor domain-containing protein [Hymenobacter sp. BT523]MBJ6110429.1 toll/interleukin-1 receptor domain-containing protein [Hymenobacter sp. BT523]
MKYDVFISHSNKDKVFVRKLANDLMHNGVSVWLDEWNINLGDSFVDVINQAVLDSRFMLVIMSPDYFNSKWTQQELILAMSKEVDDKSIKTIPIMYRDCQIPSVIAYKQYADFRDEGAYSVNFNMLLRDLFTINKEDLSFNSVDNIESKEHIIGSSKESINKGELDQLKDILKEAVDALKSQPSSKSEEVLVDDKLCFTVMPFSVEELNIVYEDFVKPAVEEFCNLTCERGDDVFGSNVVMDDIRKSIEKARIIIADLTGRNPNVFYEVGIAHTLNKPVLLLSQDVEDIPFDLRHRRILIYEYSPRGCKKLEKDIVKSINSMMK